MFITTTVDYIGKILINNNSIIQRLNNQVKHGGQTSKQNNTCTISSYTKAYKTVTV